MGFEDVRRSVRQFQTEGKGTSGSQGLHCIAVFGKKCHGDHVLGSCIYKWLGREAWVGCVGVWGLYGLPFGDKKHLAG